VNGSDREALVAWIGTRVAVALLALGTLWTIVGNSAGGVPSFLSGWDHWDTGLFVKIARFGYEGYPQHYSDQGVVAFFPGEPLLLRAVHYVVRDWIAAGLLISGVAGGVACVALARIGQLDSGRLAGSRAALYLTLSPYAVFLFALVVQWFTDPVGRRRRLDVLPLLLPFAALAGYAGYTRAITGDWLAWPHAQRDYWGRSFTAPWTALHTTWKAATDAQQGSAYAWSFRAEIVALFVGIALGVVLLMRRRWAELVYVGGQVVALGTSSYYLSIARTTLLWWPLWLLLAEWSTKRRWVHPAYLSVAPALMALLVVTFVQGHWVD
jgi:hypothetical protein